MKFTIFLLFLIVVERSTQKRFRRKVPVSANSSDVQNVNINCHSCRRVVTDFEGILTLANNSSTHFSELTYEWTIEVPPDHDIFLAFSFLNEEFSLNGTFTCESCKPYFEIIYAFRSLESTFKIDKFYDIRQLTNFSVPSHKAEIRFFSGVQGNESEKLGNAGFAISFKAIPYKPYWSIYTLLSILIPAAFIALGVASFCIIMKKKGENNPEAMPLPIPIYVDLDNPACEFAKCQVKEKEKRGRGLRLRTHHSSRTETPKIITVISSLVETEGSESSVFLEGLVTPDSSNPVPVVAAEPKKQFTKKFPPKINLLNRYSRSASSTPRYAAFLDETFNEDRLSKSEDVIFERRKMSREIGKKFFNFDALPPKEDPVTQTELNTSVFLHSSSASSDENSHESIGELTFVSPKKNQDLS